MATSELLIYTDEQRDRLEQRLAAEKDKVALLERRTGTLRIIAYRAMKNCVNTIYIEDEANRTSCEYVVGDDEILEWFYHACAHRDFHLPPAAEENDGA